MRNLFLFFTVAAILVGCNSRPSPEIAFYYWRTSLSLSSEEKKVLENNNIRTLYLRFFDVGWDDENQKPVPIAPLKIKTRLPDNILIVPVVYIKNEVFENIQIEKLGDFANKVYKFHSQILEKLASSSNEIQVDCDWTERTKDSYFKFLEILKKNSGKQVSATLRLHQVKYPQITGIPPVNKGVLMYYNLGKINATSSNSIYDRKIAERYLSSISSYPLKMDVAFPIFSWGIQIRDGKVVQLLNKFTREKMQSDKNFVTFERDFFLCKQSKFVSGYYFQSGDVVKIEDISERTLVEMAKDVAQEMKFKPEHIIFYDLDEINISRYETDIFQKALDEFR